jgi:hypothetical protein
MENEKTQSEYERARLRLCAALDQIKADGINPGVSFMALVHLLADWSIQAGGKQVLWDAVGLMHSRAESCNQVEREIPRQTVN